MYLTLKVKINDVRPEIWRRIVVNDQFTFLQLHNILQASFGWDGMHLFSFNIERNLIEHDYSEVEDFKLNAKKIKLSDYPLREKMKFEYLYDFGDDWEHEIIIEKINDLGPEFPLCLDGKNNCPIEDCGGADAYMEILKKFKSDGFTEEEMDFIGVIEPEYFDIDKVNDILSDLDILSDDYLAF